MVARLLSFAFCQLRALFKAVSDDGWDDFKASIVLNALEIYFGFSIFNLISLILKRNLLPLTRQWELVIVIGGGVAIAVANHYWFQHRKGWVRFEAEFKAYSARKLLLGRAALFAVVLLLVIGCAELASTVAQLPR
jgi:hypothetical protein